MSPVLIRYGVPGTAGVTPRRRYYGSLRYPRRPILSLTGIWLRGIAPHRLGFPCCVRSPCTDMPSSLPRWPAGFLIARGPAYSSFAIHPQRRRPSPLCCRVGVHICHFEACSTFTHVTACRLAASPKRRICLKGSDGFVTSTAAPIATGWSDPVAGWELHPLKTNALHGGHNKG